MINLKTLSELDSLGKQGVRRATPLMLLAFLTIASTLVIPSARAAQSVYVFTPVNYPGASSTGAHGINTQGEISGNYLDTPSAPPCETDAHSHTYCGHGFILSNQVYRDINAPAPVNRLGGFNDNGKLVGDYAQFFFGVSNGFLYDSTSSQFHPLPAAPGACSGSGVVNGVDQTATQTGGINNLGTIVGSYEDCSGAVHAFILTGFPGSSPVFIVFDVPGSNSWSSSAWGVNNGGQIVGTYNTNGGPQHGFLRNADGTFTNIDFPASQSPAGSVIATVGQGINDQGQIVGYYIDGSSVSHGFLLSSGVYSTIDFPSATQTQAVGINSASTVVGGYIDAVGNGHGFEAKTFAQTTTSASCNPSTVAINQPTTCTATVTDTTTPTGMVRFSSSASGVFSTPSCTLAPASSSASSCSVSYNPNPGSEGTHVITGTYGGDLTHTGSSGTFNLTVTECRESDGNGDFHSGHGEGNFAFDNDQCKDGDQNQVSSTNRGDGQNFQSTQITSSTFDPVSNTVTIAGIGTSNGVPVTFTLVALETGPTTPGWVSFTFSDGYTSAGTLIDGSILLH